MSYETDDKMVSHPDHYQSGKFEVIDIIDEFTKGLEGTEAVCTANAIKYILRWKKKNGIQDVKKAIWYLQHLVDKEDEKDSKPCSVVIHKLANGNFGIESVPDKKKNHCGTCAYQWDTNKCPRARETPGTICCGNNAEGCDEWTPAVEPSIDKEDPEPCVKSHKVTCPTTGETVTVPDGEPYDDKTRRTRKRRKTLSCKLQDL